MSTETSKKQSWFAKHKKALMIGGAVLAAVTLGGTLLYLNKDYIKGLTSDTKDILAAGNKTINTMPSQKDSLNGITESSQSITVSRSGSVDVKETKTVVKYIDLKIRNLPKGQHASAKKQMQAESLKISLQEGQTLVDPFPRRYTCKAAS